MNAPVSAPSLALPPSAPRDPERQLLETAQQFQSVFVRQMFAAMRATVPAEGIAGGGAGEEMFTTLLDEHVADDAPTQLGDRLSRQIVAQFQHQTRAAATETNP